MLAGAAVGGAVGVLAFVVESWLILRAEGLAGVRMDMQGPVAAVFHAVRPQLPWLFGRIALAYVAAGVGAGAAAGWLAWLVVPEAAGRGARGLAVAMELLGMGFALVWWHAIARPALVDDLPGAATLLEWAVDAGAPWHPLAFGAVWLLAHLGVAARAHGWGRALGAAVAMAVVVGAWAWPGRPGSREPGSTPPLVVLVGIDAFRPDRLSAFGGTGAVAPNLEAFAREATLFTRAYTPIAQTEPAWRSMLTARWPHRTGVRHPLTADEQVAPWPTFASALRERGYFTSFRTDCSRWHYQAEGPSLRTMKRPSVEVRGAETGTRAGPSRARGLRESSWWRR